MQKTKIFFIFSFLILGICSCFCLPNISKNFIPTFSSDYELISRPVKVYPDLNYNSKVSKIENFSFTQKIQQKFSIAGISKKLFTFLVCSLVCLFFILSIIIYKIHSIFLVASGAEKDIDNALSQLNNLQNNIKNNLNFTDDLLIKKNNSQNLEIKKSSKFTNNNDISANKYIQNEKKYVVKFAEPLLIAQKALSKTKGFYLVDCGSEKALVGYIKDEIFVLNKFSDNINSNIQVRFTERIGNRLIYLVRNGSYKALVQVEKENMKVLLEM